MKDRLISNNGQPEYGVFLQGVHEINYMDFDLRTAMDRPLGKLSRKWKFNQFQFVSFSCERLVVGLAIVDLKLVGKCFVYLYDPQSGAFEEFSFLQPLAVRTSVEPRPNSGRAFFSQGKNRAEIIAGQGCRKVEVSLKSGLQIRAIIDEEHSEPLAVCSRAGYQGWVFTQKATALHCQGTVIWQQRSFDLEAIDALAAVDWSAGYMRRETFWNWASLSGRLQDGRRIGMNLAAGVNETSVTENALWLEGKRHKLDMVRFHYQRYNPESHWELSSGDGAVSLRFQPFGERKEKINALVIASNFTQFFGQFSGELLINGEQLVITGLWGFTEEHYARW